MTVYCNSSFADDIIEKNFFLARAFGGLVYHFQNLAFGESVKEVIYFIACGPESFLFRYGVGKTYGKRNGRLSTLFTISYETVQELEGKDLLSYIAKELLEDTEKFRAIIPKKFNLDLFKESLVEYLNDAIQITIDGQDPSEGKVLNEDIQMAMWKKFSRL